MDSFAVSVSHGLQYGVPLKCYVKTLRGTSFAPAGITDDADIRTAVSLDRLHLPPLGARLLELRRSSWSSAWPTLKIC